MRKGFCNTCCELPYFSSTFIVKCKKKKKNDMYVWNRPVIWRWEAANFLNQELLRNASRMSFRCPAKLNASQNHPLMSLLELLRLCAHSTWCRMFGHVRDHWLIGCRADVFVSVTRAWEVMVMASRHPPTCVCAPPCPSGPSPVFTFEIWICTLRAHRPI